MPKKEERKRLAALVVLYLVNVAVMLAALRLK